MSDAHTNQQQRGWLAVQYQTTESLVKLSAGWGISPGQVASIVESPDGTLTLSFEPTPEQRESYARRSERQTEG
jgi:hypothetical protein